MKHSLICICLSDSYGGGEKIISANFNSWQGKGLNCILITNNMKLYKSCYDHRDAIFFVPGMSQFYGTKSVTKRFLEISWLNFKVLVFIMLMRVVKINYKLSIWANSHCSAYTFPFIFIFFRKKAISIHIGRSSVKFQILYKLFCLVGIKFIAVSNAVKDTLINIGINKKNITVIYNGI